MTNLSQPSGDELIEECRRRAAHERSMAEPDSHVRRENAVAFDKAATTLQSREAEILALRGALRFVRPLIVQRSANRMERTAALDRIDKALSDTGGGR